MCSDVLRSGDGQRQVPVANTLLSAIYSATEDDVPQYKRGIHAAAVRIAKYQQVRYGAGKYGHGARLAALTTHSPAPLKCCMILPRDNGTLPDKLGSSIIWISATAATGGTAIRTTCWRLLQPPSYMAGRANTALATLPE
jgi:hypothetical protein